MKTVTPKIAGLLISGMLFCMYLPSLAQEEGFMIDIEPKDSRNSDPPGVGVHDAYVVDPEKEKAQGEEDAIETKRKPEPKQTKDRPEPKIEQKEEPAKNSNPTNNPAQKEEDSDSVLSFNFLYYMIQKFKFSDVIDQ